MYKNAKLYIVIKLIWGFLTTSHSSDARIGINNNICTCSAMLKKMLGIVFNVDVCTLHWISYKNDFLNLCPYLTLSVSYGP